MKENYKRKSKTYVDVLAIIAVVIAGIALIVQILGFNIRDWYNREEEYIEAAVEFEKEMFYKSDDVVKKTYTLKLTSGKRMLLGGVQLSGKKNTSYEFYIKNKKSSSYELVNKFKFKKNKEHYNICTLMDEVKKNKKYYLRVNKVTKLRNKSKLTLDVWIENRTHSSGGGTF